MSTFDPVVAALAPAPVRSAGQATPQPSVPDYWALQKINDYINRDFRTPDGRPLRDCEWFSHFKNQELKKLGLSGQLLDVETETSDTGTPNHRVVVVGDWVLDNRHKNPYKRSTFKRMGYKEYPNYVGTPR